MVTALTSHLVSEFKYKPKRINPRLLPDDLWKVILEFGDFDMSDLSNIRLTCKHFAALGALETRYHFTLYTKNIYRRIVPSASDTFLVNPSNLNVPVNPSRIYHCRVVEAYNGSVAAGRASTELQCVPLAQGLQHIFQFTNLIRLEVRRIVLDNETFASLHQFYNLKTLQVEDCIILAERPPTHRLMEVSSFFLRAPKQIYRPITWRSKFGWLDILNSDSIHSLHIDIGQPDSNYFLGFDVLRPPTIGIHYHPEVPCCCGYCILARIISFPSALEELHIRPFHENWHRSPGWHWGHVSVVDPLPMLRIYDGPGMFFFQLQPSPKLKSVTLRGLVGNFGMHPWQDVLGCSQEQSELIYELNVHVRSIPVALLNGIGRTYNSVKTLRIFVSESVRSGFNHVTMKVSNSEYHALCF